MYTKASKGLHIYPDIENKDLLSTSRVHRAEFTNPESCMCFELVSEYSACTWCCTMERLHTPTKCFWAFSNLYTLVLLSFCAVLLRYEYQNHTWP